MDCWANVLIDHVKERCGYSDVEEQLVLQTEDSSLIELHTMGCTSATEALAPKGTYILAKVVQGEDGTVSPEMLWTPPEGYVAPAAAGGKGKK